VDKIVGVYFVGFLSLEHHFSSLLNQAKRNQALLESNLSGIT
jgi:hypothetical protein